MPFCRLLQEKRALAEIQSLQRQKEEAPEMSMARREPLSSLEILSNPFK